MPRSIDETRRDFLRRLAKTAAFVPPAMATFDVRPGSAQGKGTTQAQSVSQSATVGELSPTAQVQPGADFRLDPNAQASPAPWTRSRPGEAPPWSRPPPTQTGR